MFILVSVCITAVTFQVLDRIAEIRKQMIDGVSVYVIVEDYQLFTDAGLEDAVSGKWCCGQYGSQQPEAPTHKLHIICTKLGY